MNKYKLLQEVVTVSLFSITLLFYQTFARADGKTNVAKNDIQAEIQKETQGENLDFLQLEDEFLQTSTDDVQAQRQEAREEATLAKKEERAAEAKMKQTKAKKERVEAAAVPKIDRDRILRRQALGTIETYTKKTRTLEMEIASIERRLEKYEMKTKSIMEDLKKSKDNYDLLKQKRADLKDRERRARADRKKVDRESLRKVAAQ